MTPILGPLILVALPLLAAAVTYLLRRWVLGAALSSAATAGVLAILCLQLPLDRSAFVLGQEVAFGRPVVVLSRELVLDPAGQVWLAFVFTLAAVLYLIAWRIPQGRFFYPVSLIILSLYALVTLLQNFSLAVLAFAISATLTVFMTQTSLRQPSVRGAQRYLIVTLVAVPLLLAAAWLVDQSLLASGNVTVPRQALLPTVLGFSLLLAVFPFGTWMPALAADAPPLVTAFVFAGGQAMALYLVMVLWGIAPWLLRDPATPAILELAGLVTALSAGVMAAAQRDLGRLFGYAALSGLGYLLLALAAGGSQGQVLALLVMLNRAPALSLMGAGLAMVRQRAGSDRFADLGGVAQRLPVATMGLLIGGLALGGFPLTSSFATHWAVGRAIWAWAEPLPSIAPEAASSAEPLVFGLEASALVILPLLASAAGILIGLLRSLSAMLGAGPRREVSSQPIIASLMILVLVALLILAGLRPQLFLERVSSAVAVFSAY
jgi:formate hydrogenlyase subunit 3/multisubunit Na+/H+ antiporter MnhD subunit